VAEAQAEAPLVIHALQEPLLEALQETDTQPPVQNEDLAWRPFVLVVVYYFVAGIQSGRRLLTHLPHADPALGLPTELKKSTFFDAFRRFNADQARKLFYSLLSRISFYPVSEMAALGVLCAVDGSHWPALFRMSWAAVGSNKPTVLLHLAFGLNQMIPVAILLTESNSSERKALGQIIQSGVTYIADRGYFAYYLLKDIAAAWAFFVIRAPCNVTYQILEVLPVNLPSGMNWLFDVQDLKVHCDKEEDSGTWRVVRFVIGKSEFVLFSNRWDLSTWQIVIIYAYRWQIELFFLFIKRTLNGLHLLTYSKNGLQIQFYLMLIAVVLLLHFKQRNEAATAQDAPQGEAVQVPLDNAKAAEQPENGSGTACSQEESEAPGSVHEKEPPTTATETREDVEQAAAQQHSARTNQGDKAAPTSGKTEAERGETKPASNKARVEKPTRQATIEDKDNAEWYQDLGKKLHTFWRISVHWLQTLRDNLARVWRPAVFSQLAGYAKPSK
jgi:Transposase DDE domain